MRDDRGITRGLGHGNRVEGLGQAADLVELDQDGVGHPPVDTLFQNTGIGDKQVVPYQLYLVADFIGKQFPAIPVGLIQAVFDGDNRMARRQLRQVIGKGLTAELLALAGQVVDTILVELGGGAVQGQGDIRAQLVASFVHRFGNGFQGRFIRGQVRREPALITHRRIQAAGRQHFFQVVENFRPGAQALRKTGRGHRLHHEFLNIHIVIRVLAAIEDIHHRHRHTEFGAAIDVGDVLVQGNPARAGSRLGRRQGHGQNSIGAKFCLVIGAVGLDHAGIQLALVRGISAQQQVPDRSIDMPHGLQHTFTHIATAIAIAQFQRLTGAGGCTGGRAGLTDFTGGQGDFRHYRGIAPGIHDLKGLYIRDITHCLRSVVSAVSNR